MTKKSLIITIGSITGSISTIVGISVPIAIRKHKHSYEVNISSASDARYVVTKIDPSQNKGKQTDENKRIWDIKDEDIAKNNIAKFIGVSIPSQVQLTIKKNKKYSNGLEKLFYDLLKAEKNSNTLTLNINKGHKQILDKNYLNGDLTNKFNILQNNLTNNNSELIKGIESIYYYNSSNTNKIQLTTYNDAKTALDKMYAARKK